MAVALQDYVAPDCRFLTIYRGQVVYVFSKLKGRGRLFWEGSVSLQSDNGKGVGVGLRVKPHFPSEGKNLGEGKTRFGGKERHFFFITYCTFTLEIIGKFGAKAPFQT